MKYEETPEELKELFEFLGDLRDSGEVNMYLAPRYLTKFFDVPIADARRIVGLWMGGLK